MSKPENRRRRRLARRARLLDQMTEALCPTPAPAVPLFDKAWHERLRAFYESERAKAEKARSARP